MTKIKRGLWPLALFLLLAGGMLAGVQKAEAQTSAAFSLDETLLDAGVWLRTHLPRGTRAVLIGFSTPSKALSNYSSEKLALSLNDLGVARVMRADQADYNTASSIGRTNGIETIMMGSISRYEGSRYYFDLQIAGTNGNVWDQFTGIIRGDKTFRTLVGR